MDTVHVKIMLDPVNLADSLEAVADALLATALKIKHTSLEQEEGEEIKIGGTDGGDD